MNYELAKELMDAGHEFRRIKADMCVGPWPTLDMNPTGDQEIGAQHFYAPTLEELIEACDTEFYRLHRIDGGHWMADDVNGKYEEIAPTPTEAVARLWRALNGKKRGEGEK